MTTTTGALDPLPGRRALARLFVPLLGATTLLPFVPSGAALLLGIAAALVLGNPWPAPTRTAARRLLAIAVVALGAGMDLFAVARVGAKGIGVAAVGILLALGAAIVVGRRLGVARDASLLVGVGTAICGGSAIAAAAPVLGARDEDTSIALVTVFLLNGVALALFPPLGHALRMTDDAFGLFCALAVHDTSSVVGAASAFGPHALDVAVAAKLARALWIVPVTFGLAAARRRRGERAAKTARPWFIAAFVAVAALVTFVPSLQAPGHLVAAGARRLLGLTLFLVGLGVSKEALRDVGARPIALGVVVWLLLGIASAAAIVLGLVV